MRCDRARPLKKPVENPDRTGRVAVNGVYFGKLLRDLRSFERVHAFGQELLRAQRFGNGPIFFTEQCYNLRELHVAPGVVRRLREDFLRDLFRL